MTVPLTVKSDLTGDPFTCLMSVESCLEVDWQSIQLQSEDWHFGNQFSFSLKTDTNLNTSGYHKIWDSFFVTIPSLGSVLISSLICIFNM